MSRLRFAPGLAGIELLLLVRNTIATVLAGPECPTCRERTRHEAAHVYINHTEELRP